MGLTSPKITPPTPAAAPLPCAAFDAAVLERTPLLGGMTEEFRCVLTNRMEVRPVGAQAWVYQAGDPARELFIVAQGSLDVVRGERVMARLAPADFFGECSFLDMQPRGTSVVAREPCVVYVIPYAALRDLYQVNVRMYALIVMNLAREVSRRLRWSEGLVCGECKPPVD